jgi:hypothetical protein
MQVEIPEIVAEVGAQFDCCEKALVAVDVDQLTGAAILVRPAQCGPGWLATGRACSRRGP